jgi:hypothetical protein
LHNLLNNLGKKKRALIIKYINKDLLTRDFVKQIIKINGYAIEHLQEYQNDIEIVTLAIINEPRSYEFISSELKDNLKILELSITTTTYPYQFASDRLKADKNLLKQMLNIKYEYTENPLKYTSNELKKDIEMILLSMKYHGSEYTWLPKEFKVNYNIIKAAITCCGYHISDIIKTNPELLTKELCLIASSNWEQTLSVLPENFKDKDIIYEIIKNYPLNMKLVSKEYQNDKKLVLIAIQNDPMAFISINERLKYDPEIYQYVWKKAGDKIKAYIPSKLHSKLL